MSIIGEEYTYKIRADIFPTHGKGNIVNRESVEVIIVVETDLTDKQGRAIIWAIYPNTAICSFKMEKIET